MHTAPDGTIWALPKLKARRIVELADEVHAERKAAVLADLNGAPDDVRLRALRTLEENRGLAADVMRWAYTARGTVRVVEESLKLLGAGTIDDLGLDLTRDNRLAVQLLGMELPEIAKAADPDADPTTVPPRGGT